MKRRDLLRELERHGCKLLRHGSRHDIYWHPLTGKRQPVPRHSEVDEHLARHIKRHLLPEE
ncbi:MAG: type II toxin-antitoxin system HicA family toxin [Verrucomicrobia bacterium]|nr:type II toxin-antitoxin system HicA family toxin [Verrucomicrobiota bacterium]